MDNKRKKLIMADGGIVFALAIFVSLAITLPLSLIGETAPSFKDFLYSQDGYYVQALITQLILAGCAVVYALVRKVDLLSACAVKTKIKPWQIAACVGLGIAMFFFVLPMQTWISNLLDGAGLAQPNPDVQQPSGLVMSNVGYLLLALVLVGAMPAVFEELIFRGYVCGSLSKSEHGIEWGAAVASAFLFAVMHMSPQQTLHPLLLGFVMAVVFFATRSLWASVIIHFTNNATVLLFSYFCPQIEGFVMANWAWIMPVALVVIAPLVWLFIRCAGKRQVEPQPVVEDGQISPRRAERNKALPFYAAGTVCCIVLWFMALAI